MASEILDVDLLAFEGGSSADRTAVSAATMASLETGFVYTTHDLSEALIDEAYELLGRFFAADEDAKASSSVPGSNGQAGYTGRLVETAAVADVPDWKEMLNWGSPIPTGHPLERRFPHRYHDPVFPDDVVPGIGAVLADFHDSVLDLQRRFLRVIAVGLGCDESFFDSMLGASPALSRAIHYPPMGDAPDDGHVWAGEHADINLITALPRATAPGLEVRTEAGWVPAAPPSGSVIVNTGIMLDRISNGRVPAGWHRVVAPPGDLGNRLSVVQFCHPEPWTILSPVATCVGPERPQRFAPIQAGDLLDQVLYDINLDESARRVDDSAP